MTESHKQEDPSHHSSKMTSNSHLGETSFALRMHLPMKNRVSVRRVGSAAAKETPIKSPVITKRTVVSGKKSKFIRTPLHESTTDVDEKSLQ